MNIEDIAVVVYPPPAERARYIENDPYAQAVVAEMVGNIFGRWPSAN